MDGISFMKVVINKYEELVVQHIMNYDEGPRNNTRLRESQTASTTSKKTMGIFLLHTGRRQTGRGQQKLSKL